MATPLVYLALAPELAQELALDAELPRLASLARVERWPGPGRPEPGVVADRLRRAAIVVTGWGTPPLTDLADWTPDGFAVRLVAHTAGTVKQLLPAAALERGLLVTHANESLAEAVAEFTIGVIIMGCRQIIPSAARLRAGQPRVPLARQRELSGATVGVIGASAIGRRVLRLLAPFGPTLLLADPYCPPETAAALGATPMPLPELLARSDIVTLHAPVTPETLGMLGAAEFALMRDSALFVNTARGRLIDHAALLAELQAGRLDAILDVTDPTEPLPPDSPFFALENCAILPHMAAVTLDARQRQSRYTIDEILRFLRGESLRFAIPRSRWETMA